MRGPRGSTGEQVPPSPARGTIPRGRASTGWVSRLLYSYRAQNQGSWHIPQSSKELLPPTPGLDIPYLFPLCAMS